MNAIVALRQSSPDRSQPAEPEHFDDMDTALEIASAIQYAPTRARVAMLLGQLQACITNMNAEAYASGRLAGLVAIGGDRETQW